MPNKVKESKQRTNGCVGEGCVEGLLSLIDSEIRWCEKHKKHYSSSHLDPKYKEGFISGLEQSKYLIKGWKGMRGK